MYVEYNLDGAVTGRLSNSGLETANGKAGVSFHTLPRESDNYNIRDYVIAGEGRDFITADYKGMELRIFAHVAKERNMISAFKNGVDLHTYSAAMTFNCKESEVHKEQRQIAKEVSFLVLYGGTAFTLANKRKISEYKANQIVSNWMKAFPGVQRYMDYVRDEVSKNGRIRTIFGRYRNLPNIRSPIKSIVNRAYRQGLNFTVQSPSSDLLLCAIIGIEKRIKEENLDAELVATVHDSVEYSSRRDHTKRVVEIIREEMISYRYAKEHFNIELLVPLEVDVEVGTSFGNGKPYH
jgi:DNA polymerase-1